MGTFTLDEGERKSDIVTARNSSCGKVMFSQACVKNSVHRRGKGVHSPPPRQTPTRQAPLPEMATKAGGAHSIGMHSC